MNIAIKQIEARNKDDHTFAATMPLCSDTHQWYINPWSLYGQNDELSLERSKYEDYVNRVTSANDFLAFFNKNGRFLSRQQITDKWSSQFSDYVFSQETNYFVPGLVVHNGYVFDPIIAPNYEITIRGTTIPFSLSTSDDSCPKNMTLPDLNNQKMLSYELLWNWNSDDLRDYTFYLWEIFCDYNLLPYDPYNHDENLVKDKDYDGFMSWDQYSKEIDEADVNILRCMQLLYEAGYLEIFNIVPDVYSPWWSFRGKSDGSIDMALLNKDFKKDTLVLDKIRLVLACAEKKVASYRFFLTDRENHQFLSKSPGTFGGHRKLKIYGTLGCPSALRYIANGKYKRYRVFFENEATAIAAGYRPCAKCMPEAYKQWKEKRSASDSTK